MLRMVHLITAWLTLEQQTLGGCVDVKSPCVYVYSETLPGCSKDRGGPPTGGVGGAPSAQPVEDEAAGRGAGRRLQGLLPTHLCASGTVRAEGLLEGDRMALLPVGPGWGDGGTAWRVLLTPRPLSSCLGPFDGQ